MAKERFPGFEKCMALMRKSDPQDREDGFHWLRPRAQEHVAELLAAFGTETDHGLRCWLLELLGDARSEEAFDVFAQSLCSSDESFRIWAIRGLRMLSTPGARKLLFEARSYVFPTSDETERFRQALEHDQC